jgi:hypothetical protein
MLLPDNFHCRNLLFLFWWMLKFKTACNSITLSSPCWHC